jgi:hypothetical protein
VRSPFRLTDALRILSESKYNGDWADPESEAGFGRLMHEAGYLRSVADGKTGEWNGRKWRAAMYQLGFITPEMIRDLPPGQVDMRVQQAGALLGLSGLQYEVTPNGMRLAKAETVVQMEECFLRSLLAYRVPSPIESRSHFGEPFSPLRIVLKTMVALESRGVSARISFEEMASLVQFCKSEAEVPRLVEEIAQYRAERKEAAKKANFDVDFRARMLERHGFPVKPESLTDYADVNFRYLRATGILTRGKAYLAMTDEKRHEIALILEQPDVKIDDDEYLRRLWNGAPLPTDDVGEAQLAIRRLETELRKGGRSPAVPPQLAGLPSPDLQQIRLRLEDERRLLSEERFAAAQRSEVAGISELLALMEHQKLRSAAYRSDAPAYFEWAMWRAFLAINTLANKPWEVRQFEVDAQMNPRSHAPSRRPDMVCEFDDYVLVVEVTFLDNSRQEAAEGEPVRRHVAEIAVRHSASGKPVYGLFIAPKIDINTAETFGRGTFVMPTTRQRVPLSIVPLTLGQFRGLFDSGFGRPAGLGPADVRDLLDAALDGRSEDGEAWMTTIEELVDGRL